MVITVVCLTTHRGSIPRNLVTALGGVMATWQTHILYAESSNLSRAILSWLSNWLLSGL
jgi:hypothetical protein